MGRKKKTEEISPISTGEPIITYQVGGTEPLSFKTQYDLMYQITDKIVNKILSNGGTLQQDSYVVREEFGEALAAGYRYLRYQGETSAKLRDAGHDNEERDYTQELYEEIADVFMMTTSLCRHKEYQFEGKPFEIYREINMTLEQYLKKVSEVLFRINTDSVNEAYVYEFLEETFTMLPTSILDAKINKLYNKIFKVVE